MGLLLIRREAAIGGRVGRIALATALFALLAPATALGAGTASISGGSLKYQGDASANTVGISQNDTSFILTETGITAGTGCASGPGADQATCPRTGVAVIVVSTGDQDDRVTIDPSVTTGAQLNGGPGNDVLTGGQARDTVTYATGATAGVTVDLSRTDAQDTIGSGVDTLSNIENVDGTSFADNLTGNSAANIFNGFAGSDTINSTDGEANDAINCGPQDVADRAIIDPGDATNGCEEIDDGVAPGVQITSGPPDLSGSRAASFEFTSGDPNLDHFECGIDGATPTVCGSPAGYDLGDGPHTFAVQGVDKFGHIGAQATFPWTIDVGAPNINIDGPSGTIDVSTATFRFSTPDSDLKRFDCSIDGSNWVECESPITLSFLPDGPHTFAVRAIDKAGNVGQLTVSFMVAVPAGPSGVVKKPVNSLVLIAGNTVKVTKRGYAYIALNCSGTRDCAGKVLLDTAKKVRAGRKKRILRLGHAKFQIRATRTRRIRIHISKSKMRLLRKLRKVNTDIVVRDRDGAGRARVSSRTISLKAPPR